MLVGLGTATAQFNCPSGGFDEVLYNATGQCPIVEPLPPPVINLGPDTPVFKAEGTAPRPCGIPWVGDINNCLLVAVLGIAAIALFASRK